MGSQPTLDPAPTKPPDTGQQPHGDAGAGRAELLEHLQTPAAFGGHEFGDWPLDQIANGFGGDLHARHRHDHTRLTHVFHHLHPHPHPERDAVNDCRQNDPNPAIWQPGQDYRAADAIQAARHQPTRTRHGPERTGPER
jgi:hypothetical protein